MCTLKNQSMFDYGTRIRIRHILQEPESLGRKCPRHLMEREICYDQKCFTFSWKTGPYVKETRYLCAPIFDLPNEFEVLYYFKIKFHDDMAALS